MHFFIYFVAYWLPGDLLMPNSLPILVVDDTEICRMGTALMLDQLGFRCELAHNGFDALALFKPGKYAAVLMDYEMQGMSGAECTEIGRAHV